jgi:aminopeptidase-like protein
MGGENSSSRRRDTIAVHNGADDNASGVAAVLEIAEKIYSQKDDLSKNFKFVLFGAEEMGLLGSKYFVENSNIDSSSVTAMLNLDMVGRMKPDSSIQIGGTGTSLETKEIINEINNEFGFKIAMSDAGYGPSDHAAFYAKDIPVFFISSGAHSEYHTPDDDLDALNIEGIQMIANYTSEIATHISQRSEGLTYQESGPKSNPGGGRRYKVALGIMPDFTSTENNGLGVDFVSPGKPGHNGGMKKGDLIVAIDGKPIKNIHEYMFRMSKHNVGDRITVTVQREENEEVLIIQL